MFPKAKFRLPPIKLGSGLTHPAKEYPDSVDYFFKFYVEALDVCTTRFRHFVFVRCLLRSTEEEEEDIRPSSSRRSTPAAVRVAAVGVKENAIYYIDSVSSFWTLFVSMTRKGSFY